MVQIDNINFWDESSSNVPALDVDLRKIEILTQCKLPDSYISLMKLHDGGYPKRDVFLYSNIYNSTKESGNIGKMFSSLNGDESVLGDLLESPEFFPKGLVPFADDGGGDLTCFDYRKCKENPPIVFWVCGDPEGEDVHFVASSFEEFLNMLYEPEDI